MIDLSPYPNDIGKTLNPQPHQFELDKNTIIRIFGLAGAGKGTLAKQLVDWYQIDNLETSYILRSATYIYLQLGLEFNNKNTKKVFNQLSVNLVEGKLQFIWFKNEDLGEILADKELRSNEVQKNVAKYSGDKYFRDEYYGWINYILNTKINKAVILDGRGSSTPYLNKAQQDGFKIIRIFLWVNEKSNYKRYKAAYMDRNKISELEWTPNNEIACTFEFKTNISDRNLQDYENAVSNNLGLLTPETGIIDTSELTPIQVLQIAVDFIQFQK